MFSKEVLDLLKQVIMSWQVIAVTVALVIYIYIVSYAARSYHRPRIKKTGTMMRKKSKASIPAGPVEAESASNTNEELGLEEA